MDKEYANSLGDETVLRLAVEAANLGTWRYDVRSGVTFMNVRYGEFFRETLVQLVYLRFEVARLKGHSEEAALGAALHLLEEDFEAHHKLTDTDGSPDWAAFKEETRAAVLRLAAENEL